jgi:hypothetical protein
MRVCLPPSPSSPLTREVPAITGTEQVIIDGVGPYIGGIDALTVEEQPHSRVPDLRPCSQRCKRPTQCVFGKPVPALKAKQGCVALMAKVCCLAACCNTT